MMMIDAARLQGPAVKYNVAYMAKMTTAHMEAKFEYYSAEHARTANKNYRARWQMEAQRQNREHRDLYAAALRDRYAGVI